MKATILLFSLILLESVAIFGQNSLQLGPNDLRAEQSIDGGYFIYIRKKPGINSVILTESTRDPSFKADSYTWRAKSYNSENGDERRILDGEYLDGKKLWSLVDSTSVKDPEFGEAFKIFVPYIVVFGYPWSRYGEIQVLDGTYVNVRTFEKTYADYSGKYQDNPFSLRVTQAPLSGPPEGNYMAQTVKSFTDLANNTKASVRYSTGEADLPQHLKAILKTATGPDLDLVICIDATKSMENDVPYLKKELANIIKENMSAFSSWRIGIVQYRDYMEEFLYQIAEFSSDPVQIQKSIERVRPQGGRDIPEAVNEALFAALNEYKWQAKTRMIILIGDAPPHPIPRGTINESMVLEKAKVQQVQIETIILPQ